MARRTLFRMSRVDAEPTSWIGKILDDKLVLRERIGGGAMGDVYLAWHQLLEKNVAVKVLQPTLARDPLFVGRFHREALAASHLDHPRCIRVYDRGEVEGCPYLTMDYVAGGDLQRLLRNEGALDPREVASILLQALEGLEAAHAAGIVHRDVKPENLLLIETGSTEPGQRFVVKIADFGIAQMSLERGERRSEHPLTSPGVVMGTPEYMSPEQARAEVVDARSDLYALGVVAFQLLTGTVPFDAPSPVALLMRHLTDPVPDPCKTHKAAHPGLASVAMRAMQKAPEDRYRSAHDMRRAIEMAMQRPGRVRRTSPERLGFGLLAGAVAAAGLFLGVNSAAEAPHHHPVALTKAVFEPAPSSTARSRDEAAQRELDAWYAALSSTPSKRQARPRPTPKVRSYYDLVDDQAAPLAAR